MAEIDAAFLVDLGDLYPNHITDINHILNLFNAALCKLRDMNQAFLAGSQFYKSSELKNASNLAVI